MRTNLLKIGAAFVMIACLSGFASGSVAANGPSFSQANGIATISSSTAKFTVTGGNNVPDFHIQHSGSNTNYLVKFMNMQEFVDKNNDGLFQQSELVARSQTTFPGQGWNFSGFHQTNDTNGNLSMLNFNFTHTGTPSIALQNYINIAAGNQLKFDIAVNQYSWTSTSTSAKLAIEMQIAGGNLSKGTGNNLNFGNAYLNTVNTATSNGATIGVSTQISNGNTFYIIIDHFNANFTLDPLFGVNSVSSTSTPSNSSTPSASSTPGFEVIPFVAGFAVIGIVLIHKRKN